MTGRSRTQAGLLCLSSCMIGIAVEQDDRQVAHAGKQASRHACCLGERTTGGGHVSSCPSSCLAGAGFPGQVTGFHSRAHNPRFMVTRFHSRAHKPRGCEGDQLVCDACELSEVMTFLLVTLPGGGALVVGGFRDVEACAGVDRYHCHMREVGSGRAPWLGVRNSCCARTWFSVMA